MNCAIIKPINKAMGGVMSGDKQNTNANKKINSLVVMVRSKILLLGCFGSAPDFNSCIVFCVLILQK